MSFFDLVGELEKASSSLMERLREVDNYLAALFLPMDVKPLWGCSIR